MYVRYVGKLDTENTQLRMLRVTIYLGQVIHATPQVAGAMSYDAPLLFSHCCLI